MDDGERQNLGVAWDPLGGGSGYQSRKDRRDVLCVESASPVEAHTWIQKTPEQSTSVIPPMAQLRLDRVKAEKAIEEKGLSAEEHEVEIAAIRRAYEKQLAALRKAEVQGKQRSL